MKKKRKILNSLSVLWTNWFLCVWLSQRRQNDSVEIWLWFPFFWATISSVFRACSAWKWTRRSEQFCLAELREKFTFKWNININERNSRRSQTFFRYPRLYTVVLLELLLNHRDINHEILSEIPLCSVSSSSHSRRMFIDLIKKGFFSIHLTSFWSPWCQ